MSTDYYINSITHRKTNDRGRVILVEAAPYEDTPFGYSYIMNNAITIAFPYSVSLINRLKHNKEENNFQVDFSRLEYDVQHGWYLHETFNQKENTIILNSIDLGLSVLWADRNIGALDVENYGTMQSYNDIISKKIEINGWRLPYEKEFQELLGLQIKYNPTNKSLCFWGNGNKLFLPLAGVFSQTDYNIYREGQWGVYLGRYDDRDEPQCEFSIFRTDSPFISASFDMDKPFSIRLVKDR